MAVFTHDLDVGKMLSINGNEYKVGTAKGVDLTGHEAAWGNLPLARRLLRDNNCSGEIQSVKNGTVQLTNGQECENPEFSWFIYTDTTCTFELSNSEIDLQGQTMEIRTRQMKLTNNIIKANGIVSVSGFVELAEVLANSLSVRFYFESIDKTEVKWRNNPPPADDGKMAAHTELPSQLAMSSPTEPGITVSPHVSSTAPTCLHAQGLSRGNISLCRVVLYCTILQL